MIFNNISLISKKEWNTNIPSHNIFIEYDFLLSFQNNNLNNEHIFIKDLNYQFYGHSFTLKISKANNYTSFFTIFFNIFLRLYPIKFFYLTNSFITNVPSFFVKGTFSFDKILKEISVLNNPLITIIPDFLFDTLNFKNQDLNFIKTPIEDEMKISIDNNWSDFDCYTKSLKTKYRKRIKSVITSSNEVIIKVLNNEELLQNKDLLQLLFNQVIDRSSFSGPSFNICTLIDLSKAYNEVNIFGFFLKGELVAFSSEISIQEKLYSYFVGFDYHKNKKYSLYSKILCECISNAIKQKKKVVVLGRTANEFKSNFGAVPFKSSVYLKVNNKFLAYFLNPYIKKMKTKAWTQRRPFKNNL